MKIHFRNALILLILIFSAAWVVCAYRFENTVRKDFLPRIASGNCILNTNIEDAVIEKFKFRVKFQEVIIGDDQGIHSDILYVQYNPFKNTISLNFDGKDILIGDEKENIIISSPDQTITFDKDLLDQKYDDFSVRFVANKWNMQGKEKKNVYMACDKIGIILSNKIDAQGYYNINLDIDTKSGEQNLENKDQQYEKYIEIVKKLQKETGPSKSEMNLAIKIDQKQIENISSVLQGELTFQELKNGFDFIKDKYSIALNIKQDSVFKSSLISTINNDGDFIKIMYDAKSNAQYKNQQQKQNIHQLITELSDEIAPSLNGLEGSESFVPVFKEIIQQIMKIEKSDILFSGEYDFEKKVVNTAAKIKINDVEVSLDVSSVEGLIKDIKAQGLVESINIESDILYGTLIINTPQTLISGIVDLANTDAAKIIVSKSFNDSVQQQQIIDSFLDNIKLNGFNFSAALHEKPELAEDEKLVTNFRVFAFGSEEMFKINDKNIAEILQDTRVIKFLSPVPEIDTKQSQNQSE